MAKKQKLGALIDFQCEDDKCGETVVFDIMTLKENDRRISCPNCHRLYNFNKRFVDKLEKLRNLVLAVKESEDIIDDCNVAVDTPMGGVKVPYRLLLTRLNTLISLKVKGKIIDFNFRIEPLNNTAFK